MADLYFYLLPTAFVATAIALHVRGLKKHSRLHAEKLEQARAAGLAEPASLHPVVDESRCMGSGSCARACPEKALGVVNGKAVLINPDHCIGHGACAAACPVSAIRLVFGSAKRGVEIPQVSPEFETNVPGIFIAGELGGMGLIRNAVRQGMQAIQTLAKRPRGKFDWDVVIVGAGPAGIAASLTAQHEKLRYVTLEQEDSLGGTTYHYPRNKLVMTAPMKLPIIGEIKLREVSKERLLEIWQSALDKAQLNVRFSERMEEIIKEDSGFTVRTNKAAYRAAQVVLAIGRRGTPRKLGAKGEEHPKVVYRLIEAEQYRQKKVMVVGGGDSALEAALDIGNQPGTTVHLAYRGKAFDRIKPRNRERLEEAVSAQRVQLLMETTVPEITPEAVIVKMGEAVQEIANDAMIVCAGGELPTSMLKKIGIQVEAHYGT